MTRPDIEQVRPIQQAVTRVVSAQPSATTSSGGGGGGQFIQVQPQQTLTPQRCIIQGPTLTRLSSPQDPQPSNKINTIIQQKLASATPVVQQQQQPPQVQVHQQQQSNDLIRQLNLARAHGLVVLQQWGDKQVLVHKATGRWIMRQGNRLVTVPPQALGITGSGTEASGGEGDKDETAGNTE